MSIRTVFLSSTARDLAEYRQAVYDAIEGLDGYHCVRMENFGARDWDADEFCRAKVAECDLLVGIVGHLYGSCPEGKEQSYTEREYEAAIAAGIPRLMFFAPGEFPVPANLIESDEERKKQHNFRERVSRERIRDSFTSPEDLAGKVRQAIFNLEKGQAAQERLPPLARAEGVLPLPPQPCFAHPYPLQEHFTGRVNERESLTRWLTEGDEAVFVLEAIGGMGKSSLAWVWACRDVWGLPVPGLPEDLHQVKSVVRVPEEHKPEGLLFWSFYEGGGTFHGFLEAAIAYCSAGKRSAQDYVTEVGQEEKRVDYAEMQDHLLQLLQQRRFLLVWDGAERLLREYGGQDAAVREERDVEELSPDARDTIEIAVARFLQEVAGQASSRLLLTSRLYPRDLERLAGAGKEELTGIGEEDAVTYLRARGIQGNRAELVSAARQYDLHPLSLSNLAASLLEDFDEEGDITAAPKHDATETLKARREHILERAYERRAPHRQELVSRLAAMRGSIPKEVIRLLTEGIKGISSKTLGRDLDELVRHGLLRHPSADRYDFHPVVRRYCYQRLENKQDIHLRLMGYFAGIPTPDEVVVLEDLAPVIELYHHTVGAGRYDEAWDLYKSRLWVMIYYRFGAYQTEIELLGALFPDGEGRPSQLRNKKAEGWTLNTMANSYSLSGQPRRAVLALKLALKFAENNKDIATGLENLAYNQRALGELAVAEGSLQRSIELSCGIKNEFNEFREATGHQDLGRLLAYRGAFDEAARELDAAQASFSKLGATQSECVVWAHRALRALLMGEAKDALDAAGRARELADEVARTRYPVERDIIRAEWLLGAALVALASEERSRQSELLAEAETRLTNALTRCRRINIVELEPDILLAWARWHHAKGNTEQALLDAKEALSIADRCEYRLKQADIHNFLARLTLDAGDGEAAKTHAQTAHERAWCDGPPHCYKPALEEAERLLAEAEQM